MEFSRNTIKLHIDYQFNYLSLCFLKNYDIITKTCTYRFSPFHFLLIQILFCRRFLQKQKKRVQHRLHIVLVFLFFPLSSNESNIFPLFYSIVPYCWKKYILKNRIFVWIKYFFLRLFTFRFGFCTNFKTKQIK